MRFFSDIKKIQNEKESEKSNISVNKNEEKSKLENIINHFFPKYEKCIKLEELFNSRLKNYFVAISKYKTFAIYCKDSGTWKRIYGDNRLKITNSTAGTKLKYTNIGTTMKIKPGESYNLFILK